VYIYIYIYDQFVLLLLLLYDPTLFNLRRVLVTLIISEVVIRLTYTMASSMAFKEASSSSSSSSSFSRRWLYDVFLSFKGQDTSDQFTANLYNALCEKEIYTYKDDKLKGREQISTALVKAVKESRTSIVVLSANYASSTWCLEELVEILDCRDTKQQIVLPIFYNVDPSDVRHQKKSFGEPLAKHEDRFKKNTLDSWKVALNKVANLSGWHLKNGYVFFYSRLLFLLIILNHEFHENPT
jgi:hypothetical protein